MGLVNSEAYAGITGRNEKFETTDSGVIYTIDGNDGNDSILGNNANDTLIGGLGRDIVRGLSGNDFIIGDRTWYDAATNADETLAAAADLITGDGGDDTIFAGDGNNYVSGGTGLDFINGGSGNELLGGGEGNDRIYGLGGNDRLFGGSDTLQHNTDFLNANFGSITIGFDGLDNSTLPSQETSSGASYAGNGIALTNTGSDYIDGGVGDDYLDGQDGSDVLLGGAGDDTLVGGDDDDQLFGGDGDDILNSSGGGDLMSGGAGSDAYLANFDDKLFEAVGAGADDSVQYYGGTAFRLGANVQIERMSLAHDTATTSVTLTGNDFAQSISGNAGANTIAANGADDSLFGLGGDDQLFGGAGSDILNGGSGLDYLEGGSGNDTFFGGSGNDTLLGGSGLDIFVFNAGLGSTNVDTINGYTVADDVMQLSRAVFKTVNASGALFNSAYYTGSAAHDSSDRIIYDASNGKLYYDDDGTGAHAAIQIATLGTGLAISAGEFVVIA